MYSQIATLGTRQLYLLTIYVEFNLKDLFYVAPKVGPKELEGSSRPSGERAAFGLINIRSSWRSCLKNHKGRGTYPHRNSRSRVRWPAVRATAGQPYCEDRLLGAFLPLLVDEIHYEPVWRRGSFRAFQRSRFQLHKWRGATGVQHFLHSVDTNFRLGTQFDLAVYGRID